MKFTQKIFVVSDTGAKEFKDKEGKSHPYRLITVVGDNDVNPLRVSVAMDFDIKVRTEQTLEFSAEADFKGNVKLRAILPV